MTLTFTKFLADGGFKKHLWGKKAQKPSFGDAAQLNVFLKAYGSTCVDHDLSHHIHPCEAGVWSNTADVLSLKFSLIQKSVCSLLLIKFTDNFH